MSEDFFRKERYEVAEMPGKISSLSLKPPAEDWRISRNVLFTCTKDSTNYFCRGKISSCECGGGFFFWLFFFLLVCSMGWQGIKNFSANPSGQNPGFFLCWCEFSY